jgi:hypothetical protein
MFRVSTAIATITRVLPGRSLSAVVAHALASVRVDQRRFAPHTSVCIERSATARTRLRHVIAIPDVTVRGKLCLGDGGVGSGTVCPYAGTSRAAECRRDVSSSPVGLLLPGGLLR